MLHLEVNENTKEYEYYENVDYQAFWRGVQQLKLDELEHKLVKKMLHLPAKRLIDIGCGYGRLMDCYQSQCEEIILLDSSSSLLQQAYQNSSGHVICIRCSLTHTPFIDSLFDQVMMVRVFHHLPDSKEALNELNRILTAGGNLLFSYCNKKNLERIGRWLIGKNPYNPFRYETAWVWDAFFMHHPHYVHAILKEVGFNKYTENGAGIIDKIAGKLGRLGKQIPPGEAIAGLMAYFEWAPWIFCDAHKPGHDLELETLPFEKTLRCVRCNSSLIGRLEGYQCLSCGQLYPFKDGVFDFLIEDS
jgi:ubiquinone/menaquinone biosynthesis C-methylase UbiE